MSTIDRAEVEGVVAFWANAPMLVDLQKVAICRSWLEQNTALLAAREERDNAIKTARQRAGEHERQVESMEQEIAALEGERDRLRAALDKLTPLHQTNPDKALEQQGGGNG